MQANKIHEAWVTHPKILKPEDVWSWYFASNVQDKGMWSESGLDKGCTQVVGKDRVQLLEVKTQSNFTRRGSVCMLLRSDSISLNIFISPISPPSLFMFSGHLMRLKSPKGPVIKAGSVKVHEPGDEGMLMGGPWWPINICDVTAFIIHPARKFDCNSIGISMNNVAIK